MRIERFEHALGAAQTAPRGSGGARVPGRQLGPHQAADVFLPGSRVVRWEEAHPELQPRVEAARRALERLAAEGALRRPEGV